MTILLYRRRLSLTSGAGQLIRMQAEGLQAAGEEVCAACRRGAFKFLLNTRLPVRRLSNGALTAMAAMPDNLVVDHQMALPEADLVFVHNLMTEAVLHLERDDWKQSASRERDFFRALNPDAPIVANSELVKSALTRHFELDPARVVVQYPGVRSDRFVPHEGAVLPAEAGARRPERVREAAQTRSDTRRSLGIGPDVPLIGFVTSGELDKRGIDIFLASAELIAHDRPEARFLVVGAKRLPEEASRHPLVRNQRVLHRRKSSRPERWFAALDVFLYPARFEEFGMVISEALASGLPVVTSRQVGAAECLPAAYGRWLLDQPDPAGFAANVLEVVADENARIALASAGIKAFDGDRYVRETVALIRECARAKAGGARTDS